MSEEQNAAAFSFMDASDTTTNPAAFQSALWGATTQEWAGCQELKMRPWYAAILDRTVAGPGTALLDIGCGAGLFLVMAAARGATVSGLDITPEFIATARSRLPDADLRVGDMEASPFASHTFDLVTGLNSFQFAADPVRALAEARRVVRPAGLVVAGVFGRPADCDLAAPLAAFTQLMPSAPGPRGPFALSENGALEDLAAAAGLEPIEIVEMEVLFEMQDDEDALRCLLAIGPAVIAMRTSGVERVREAVLNAVAPYKTAGGGYRLRNKFRYLIAHRREPTL